MHGTGFPWVGTANDVGSILNGVHSMKGTLFTGETLNNQFGVVTNVQVRSSFIVARCRSADRFIDAGSHIQYSICDCSLKKYKM
jgi:uncharacterized membrane-anchored protein